jgi:hypothetical protein
MEKSYNCITLSRKDLESIGIDTSSLNDEQMQELADLAAEEIMPEYWRSIESIAIDHFGLKQTDM